DAAALTIEFSFGREAARGVAGAPLAEGASLERGDRRTAMGSKRLLDGPHDGTVVRNDQTEADAHVEHAVHLGAGHVSELLNESEDRLGLGERVELEPERGLDARQAAQTAPGDVHERQDPQAT